MTKTPSPEDEFFAKQDAEKLRQLRETLDKKRADQRRAQEKQEHWMRCPKCGAALEEVSFKGVLIDRCAECEGVFLDKGELEILAGGESAMLKNMARFFGVHRDD